MLLMSGIKIGNNVIISNGAVVTKNIPSHCIAVGNPARIIKEHIQTKLYRQLIKG
jgi:acetyltransferase-like isoleucine patch superfamily enzyme